VFYPIETYAVERQKLVEGTYREFVVYLGWKRQFAHILLAKKILWMHESYGFLYLFKSVNKYYKSLLLFRDLYAINLKTICTHRSKID
jgi:hypothetical protein